MSWTVSIVLRTDASKAAAKSFSDPSGLDCAKMKTELSSNATTEAVNAFFIINLSSAALVFRDALNTNGGSQMFGLYVDLFEMSRRRTWLFRFQSPARTCTPSDRLVTGESSVNRFGARITECETCSPKTHILWRLRRHSATPKHSTVAGFVVRLRQVGLMHRLLAALRRRIFLPIPRCRKQTLQC